MKRPLHECAALGCDRLVPTHLLMCIDHWRMVPAELQREVKRTLSRSMSGSLTPEERLLARRAYLAAVNRAVEVVALKQERKAEVDAGGSGRLF